jgi:hypothetical protein
MAADKRNHNLFKNWCRVLLNEEKMGADLDTFIP